MRVHAHECLMLYLKLFYLVKLMLVIRFSRVGRHNHAQYRIVVQEKSKAPTGKHIAIVGSYDPHSKQTVLKEEIIKQYLANGAQPSDSVYNLLVRNEIITGAKRPVKIPEKKVEAEETEAEENSKAQDSKDDEIKEEKKDVDAKEENKSESTKEESKKEEK
jgi:small subunit ribosomal protein S16